MKSFSYNYNQHSASLSITGMPDITLPEFNDKISILSSWKLQILGLPTLEGKKNHLDHLMSVVSQYSNSYLYGIKKSFVSPNNTVSICNKHHHHQLTLISSQKDIKPLEILLDDSELSDLTKCLDLLRYDNRVNITWIPINYQEPSNYKNIDFLKLSDKLLYTFLGIVTFVFVGSLLFLIPTEPLDQKPKQSTNTENIFSNENK